MSDSLRIRDGGTERVGFTGLEWRGAIEMVVRPFTGMTALFEYRRVENAMKDGVDPTPLMCKQIADRVAELRINGQQWPTDEAGRLDENALRELRAREFETVAFCVLGKLDPEFKLVSDPEDPGAYKQVPYPSAAEREGN